MRKRAMSVLLAAAMITGTMTGTAVMVKADDEPVTLTVLAGQSTTDAGIEDMIDEALAEKYPNITLEWECVDLSLIHILRWMLSLQRLSVVRFFLVVLVQRLVLCLVY